MNASQTATLDEAVSAQPNGIVLVFSRYQNGVEQNWGFESFFVPKYIVAAHADQGSYFSSNQMGRPWCKYIYISDTTLRGHADNTNDGDVAEALDFMNNQIEMFNRNQNNLSYY